MLTGSTSVKTRRRRNRRRVSERLLWQKPRGGTLTSDLPRSDGAPEDPVAAPGAGTGPDSDATPRQSAWTRLRAITWTQHLTAVGLAAGPVAAIAGLWFQAVATYWSQQTAKDQLEQSRKDDERDRQEQAALVNFWEVVSDTDSSSGTFHVINRSPDPVGNVVVLGSVFKQASPRARRSQPLQSLCRADIGLACRPVQSDRARGSVLPAITLRLTHLAWTTVVHASHLSQSLRYARSK